MIKLINTLPVISHTSVELFKIESSYRAYPNDTLLWMQDGTNTLISMLDGNMVISAPNGINLELKEFLDVIFPSSVFANADILKELFSATFEKAEVLELCEPITDPPIEGEQLKSEHIYALLNVEGLSLPPYEYFAPDFCHRINNGLAKCFALSRKCAAITLSLENTALINGIASHEKGYGRLALKEIIKRESGKRIFACAKPEMSEFYIKNGFKYLYTAGYFKKEEHNL